MNIAIISKLTKWEMNQDEDDFRFGEDKTPQAILDLWKTAHDASKISLDLVVEEVQKVANVIHVGHAYTDLEHILENKKADVVITVGGDGTLLDTSHHVNGSIPILGFNSDPETSVGFFSSANKDNLKKLLPKIIESECRITPLTRMSVTKNDKVISNRILNDVLFCAKNPATTSFYDISYHVESNTKYKERQRSSGFWAGPAAGSTAARRSAGYDPMPLNSRDLQLCIRELYSKPDEEEGKSFWEIKATEPSYVAVHSRMKSAALYIDGDYNVFDVEIGDTLKLMRSPEPLLLLGK